MKSNSSTNHHELAIAAAKRYRALADQGISGAELSQIVDNIREWVGVVEDGKIKIPALYRGVMNTGRVAS
jgi:hypothetical protein